jgi:hypothetical protein
MVKEKRRREKSAQGFAGERELKRLLRGTAGCGRQARDEISSGVRCTSAAALSLARPHPVSSMVCPALEASGSRMQPHAGLRLTSAVSLAIISPPLPSRRSKHAAINRCSTGHPTLAGWFRPESPGQLIRPEVQASPNSDFPNPKISLRL